MDANTGLLFGYPSAAIAALACGLTGATGNTGSITGTDGRIDLPSPFHQARRLLVHRRGGTSTIEAGFPGWGYHFEAAEVNRCLRAGLLESPLVPATATLEVLGILDAVRDRLGVVYPEPARSG